MRHGIVAIDNPTEKNTMIYKKEQEKLFKV